jgi:hypothetical protein
VTLASSKNMECKPIQTMFDKDSRGALSLPQTGRRFQELSIYISPNSVGSGPLSYTTQRRRQHSSFTTCYQPSGRTVQLCATLTSAVRLRLSRNESKHQYALKTDFSFFVIFPLVMLQITLPVSVFPFARSRLCDIRDAHDGKRCTTYIYSA